MTPESPQTPQTRGRGRPKGSRNRRPRKSIARVAIALRLDEMTRRWLCERGRKYPIGPGELARRLLEYAARRDEIPAAVVDAIVNR